jgi:hypothetical protein
VSHQHFQQYFHQECQIGILNIIFITELGESVLTGKCSQVISNLFLNQQGLFRADHQFSRLSAANNIIRSHKMLDPAEREVIFDSP